MSARNTFSSSNGVVYEVNITIDAALREIFSDWLAKHIEQMLQLPGFEQAFLLEDTEDDENAEDDTAIYRCTVHYLLTSMQDLQAYFTNHAQRMRAQGSERFGDALSTSRRILSTRQEYVAGTNPHIAREVSATNKGVNCLDCGTVLRGQYCYNCGQRDQRRLVSLTELVGDLVRDLVSWDSRLWRTVGPLIGRPGYLTNAYLKGQRVRYSPPLRMYLIASILFFLVASFGPHRALMNMDIDAPLTDVEVSFDNDSPNQDESQDNPATVDGQIDKPFADANQPGVMESADNREKIEKECAKAHELESPIFQDFFRERAYQSCLRLTTREGLRNYALYMLDNLPNMLFVLLPLMAFVNKLFYPFSKRYYVEHLLYYVHAYSFLFVFVTILLVANAIFDAFSLKYFGWIIGISVLYIIYYFLRSMRVVYKQSRLVTIVKWLLINLVFVGLAVTTLGIFALVTAALVT